MKKQKTQYINHKSAKKKKWLTLGLFSVLFSTTACVPPIQNIKDSSIIERANNNLPEYKGYKGYSDNFSEKPAILNPTDADDSYLPQWRYPPKFLPAGLKYQRKIAALTETQIRDDIMDSLVSLVNNYPIQIDFEHLNISFDLTKVNSKKLIIRNFKLEFKITNFGLSDFNLYQNIIIPSKSNASIKLTLLSGDIAPSYIVGSSSEGQPNVLAAAWKIKAASYPLRLEVKYLSGSNANTGFKQQFKELNLLIGRSYALNEFYQDFVDLPNFTEIYDEGLKKILKLKQEPDEVTDNGKKVIVRNDFKKDINDWFTQYFRYQMYLSYLDVKTVFEYIKSPRINTAQGKKISLLEHLLENTTERENTLKSLSVPEKMLNLINAVVDKSTKNPKPPTYDELVAIIDDILDMKIDEWLSNKIRVSIQWQKDPEVDLSDPKNPTISFDFTVTSVFLQDLVFKFKNTRIYPQEGKGPKIVSYDFQNFVIIKNILDAVMGGETSPALAMLEGLQPYIIPDKLTLREGESFSFNVRTDNSPLQFEVAASIDRNKSSNSTFGWQASNTTISFSLKNLKSLWKDIYNKLNRIPGEFDIFKGGIEKLKNQDIVAIFQFMNDIFVAPKDKNNAAINKPIDEDLPDNQRDKGRPIRPVEKLFRVLLEKDKVIESLPLKIGLSRAFYKLSDTFELNAGEQEPLWVNEKKDEGDGDKANKTIFTNNSKLTLKNIFDATKRRLTGSSDSELGTQSAAFNFISNDPKWENYANYYEYTFFTDKTTIIPILDDKKWQKLMTDLDTNDKIEANLKREVLKIFNEKYDNKWNKSLVPKVSLVRLPISNAIKDIFRLPQHSSLIGAAGFFLNWDFAKTGDSLVKRDLYIGIINTQLPGEFAFSYKSGNEEKIYKPNPNPTPMPVVVFVVPPIIEANKLKTPF